MKILNNTTQNICLTRSLKSIKHTFFFVVFMSVCFSANAWKARSDTTIYAGAWGGASYAKIMGYTGTTPLMGKAFGFQFCFQPNREISLKTGIGFIPKGFTKDYEYFDIYNNSVGFFATNYQFNYLNVPIGFSYNLGRNKFNVYLSLGIDIDILMKQITTAPLLPTLVNGNEVVNINTGNTDIYKLINLGVHVGGGVEYRIKPNIIAFADVKYMHGLNNILSVESIYSLKQRPLVVGIGFRIGIPLTTSVEG